MGKRLTFEQLCQLAGLHRAGLKQAAIAALIGSTQPVVSRELARNAGGGGYGGKAADDTASMRRWAASSRPRKMTQPAIALIEAKLRREEWSPQQIVHSGDHERSNRSIMNTCGWRSKSA